MCVSVFVCVIGFIFTKPYLIGFFLSIFTIWFIWGMCVCGRGGGVKFHHSDGWLIWFSLFLWNCFHSYIYWIIFSLIVQTYTCEECSHMPINPKIINSICCCSIKKFKEYILFDEEVNIIENNNWERKNTPKWQGK
jgi:hypothetical protein